MIENLVERIVLTPAERAVMVEHLQTTMTEIELLRSAVENGKPVKDFIGELVKAQHAWEAIEQMFTRKVETVMMNEAMGK